jgi:hypothetical protein
MQPLDSPTNALSSIMECGLTSFRYDSELRKFVLVIADYPFRSPGSIREFAAFVFTDTDFVRENGDYAPMQMHREHFQARGHGAVVIQSVSVGVLDGRQRLELWFGPNFGGIEVTYAYVEGYTRGSTATQTGPMDWQYFDSRSGEPFDFDYPFPDLVEATT